MQPIPTAQLASALDWRYAVKQFDPARRVPDDLWLALEHALVQAPSSFGLQPWRFIVVTDPAVKARLRDVSWKQSQVTDCSHHVVFAVRRGVDEAYVDRFLARQVEVRGGSVEGLAGYRKILMDFLQRLTQSGQLDAWATKQIYIALGQFMASAALLGVDTCPMEGIDPAAYDEILGLRGTEFATVVSCAAGYRAAADKYAGAKKVRFPAEEIIRHV